MKSSKSKFSPFLLTIILLSGISGWAQEPSIIPSPQASDNPPLISLFADRRAFRLGDVVTILLMEYASGSNEALTNTDLKTLLEATGQLGATGGVRGGQGIGGSIGNNNQSRGTTTRSGQLKGKLAARVVEILPNGNLKLEGHRQVVINGETQTLTLTGIVRPADIQSDNTIYSYLVSDAVIVYKGKGVIDEVAKPGLLIRFINWLF